MDFLFRCGSFPARWTVLARDVPAYGKSSPNSAELTDVDSGPLAISENSSGN